MNQFNSLKLYSLLFLIIGSVLFVGCAASKPPGVMSFDVSDLPTENSAYYHLDQDIEDNSSALHSYLVGELAYQKEDYARALKELELASKKSRLPSPHINYQLAQLYLRSGKLSQALEASQKAYNAAMDNVSYRLLHAGVLDASNRSAESIPLYEEILKAQPMNLEAGVLLSSALIRSDRVAEGIAILEKQSQLAADEDAIFYYLGRTYEGLDRFADAVISYRKATQLDQRRLSYKLDLIRVLLKDRKVGEVKEICNQILENDGDNAVIRRLLGQILINEQDYSGALEHLQALQNIEGDTADVRFKIALVQLERQNYSEAIRELSLIVAKDPKNYDARYYLASAFGASGRSGEALQELEKIPQDAKQYLQSRSLATFIAIQGEKLELALSYARQAIEVEPSNLALSIQISQLLRELTRYAEADTFLEQQSNIIKDNETLLLNRALVLNELGQPDQSIAVAQQVLDKNPNNDEALNFIAYSLAEQGRELQRALELVNRALAIKPNSGYYLDTAGWIYFKLNELKKAEEYLLRAAELSDDVVIYEHLADIYQAQKKHSKALEFYRAAQESAESQLSVGPDKEQQDALTRVKVKIAHLLQSMPELTKSAKSDAVSKIRLRSLKSKKVK